MTTLYSNPQIEILRRFWLLKTEPAVYSIDHLENDRKTPWEGVRNYQARNFMRKEMSAGDEVLIYHSNADPSGVVGIGLVAGGPKPDESAFRRSSSYYDPKSTRENPRWFCVEIAFKSRLPRIVSLAEIKENQLLHEMLLIRTGQRLSIQPCTDIEFRQIIEMANRSDC